MVQITLVYACEHNSLLWAILLYFYGEAVPYFLTRFIPFS